jgi:hypothetical protein
LDWDLCLGRNPVYANWVASAVGLAHELLGVDISETPFAGKQLPSWLAPAVLKQWGRRTRFDNPVRATATVGGKFNNWPRLPYRVAELVTRIPEGPEKLNSLLEQFVVRRRKAGVGARRRQALSEAR